MRIKTALILCAGLGKRLAPLTLKTPKPLLELNNKTILEICINTTQKLGVEKIFLNTFHLSEKISNFIKSQNFPIEIEIVDDGEEILDTGGGILNMINRSNDDDFLVFNPDTIWNESYVDEINNMQNYYFKNKLNNILLVTKKQLSFDQNLTGDFKLNKNSLKKENNKSFIYIGCQILKKDLFRDYKVKNFSISEIWNELLKKNQLNGFESLNKFYHLTNLETFNKLKDF
jgi:MurNAc alpha-1-phosphate uridylyltransferase